MQNVEPLIQIIFCVVVYGGLGYTIISILQSVLAAKWPFTRGVIIYAGISENYDSDGSTYEPTIEFRYTVRGKEYLSKRFAFGFMASNFRFLSSNIINKFKNKSSIKVYYNPKRPQKSVLLVGVRPFHIVQIIFFGIILYFFGPWFSVQ